MGAAGSPTSDRTSYDFDGALDYLWAADHTDWAYGTGNFRMEAWLRFDTFAGQWQYLFTQRESGSNMWYTMKDNADKLGMVFINSGSTIVGDYIMTNAWSGSTGVWYHVAFVRNGTTGLIFIDGVSQTLTENTAFSTNSLNDMTASLLFGERIDGGGAEFDGRADELRISDTARETSNFTPSDSEFESDANTLLLIHGGETIVSGTTGSGATFVDSGNTGHTITENNGATRDTAIYKL